MSSEILRLATLALPSVVTLVLGSLLLPTTGSLVPVLPLTACSVVHPAGRDAAVGVGLAATAAAAATRDEATVAAAQVGTDGGLGGLCAGRWCWHRGGTLTERSFNDLTARVGTATVIDFTDLYVYWKPCFVLKSETLHSPSLSVVGDVVGFNDSTGVETLVERHKAPQIWLWLTRHLCTCLTVRDVVGA